MSRIQKTPYHSENNVRDKDEDRIIIDVRDLRILNKSEDEIRDSIVPVNTFIVILCGCMRLKTSYVHGARRGKGSSGENERDSYEASMGLYILGGMR